MNLEPAGLVTREDVETGNVSVAELEDIDETGAAPWMYAWHKDMPVYDNPLDQGHWLFQHLIDFTRQEVQLEIVGETHRAYFTGQWVSGDAAFCETYRLTFGDDSVDIQGDSIYLEDEGLFVVPKGDASGGVVRQAGSYVDEHDTTTGRSRTKTSGRSKRSSLPTPCPTRPRRCNACCRRLRAAPRCSASVSCLHWTGKVMCCRWSRRNLLKLNRLPDRNSQAD